MVHKKVAKKKSALEIIREMIRHPEMPKPFGGNIEVQKSKWCYICGKPIKRGQYCRKCFNKWAE